MAKQIKKDEILKKEVVEELKEVKEIVVEKPKPFSMQWAIKWFRWPAFLQNNTFGKWKWNNMGGSSAPRRAAGRWR